MAAPIGPDHAAPQKPDCYTDLGYIERIHSPKEGIYVSEDRDPIQIEASIVRLREILEQNPSQVGVFWDFDGVATRSRQSLTESPAIPPEIIEVALDYDPSQELTSDQERQLSVFLGKVSTTHGLPCLHPDIAEFYHEESGEIYKEILRVRHPDNVSSDMAKSLACQEELFHLYLLATQLIQDTSLNVREINALADYLVERDGFIETLEKLDREGIQNAIISAGIKPFIEHFLRSRNLNISEMYLYANNIELDAEGVTIPTSQSKAMHDYVVTPNNKHFFSQRILRGENLKGAVVIGDDINDARMINLDREAPAIEDEFPGLFNTPQQIPGIKIGLLNREDCPKTQRKLQEYLKHFDIVVVGDQNFHEIEARVLAKIFD